jgi:hypothetical protein
MNDDIKKGSFEALSWLDNFYYKPSLPPVVKQIYEAKLYKKMVDTCNIEQIGMIRDKISRYGYSQGLQMAYNELVLMRSKQHRDKNEFIREQTNNFQSSYESEELHEQLEEEERWKNLNLIERSKKNQPWPYSDRNIPDDMLLSQPIIKQETVEYGTVTYEVHDKVYQVYSAAVYHKDRKTVNGIQGKIILYASRLYGQDGLMEKITEAIKKEKLYIPIEKRVQKPLGQTSSDEVIRKVKRYLNGEDDNLNGDIF